MELFTNETYIDKIAVHHIGNPTLDETLTLSEKLLSLDEDTKSTLNDYFLNGFRSEIFYRFQEGGNGLSSSVNEAFEDAEAFLPCSVKFAQQLYDITNLPQIKLGDFYTVLFKNCQYNGQPTNALGLFKVENSEAFFNVNYQQEHIDLQLFSGFSLRKPDKGCLVLNLEKEAGYCISVFDSASRGAEARFWIDHFLQLTQKENDYFNTQQAISLCKDYITKELPKNFEVQKADQIDLLNRSMSFFKENTQFDMEEFSKEVIAQPEVIDNFQSYKENIQREKEVVIPQRFDLSAPAIKKEARVFKSVIKLDKNFHIYVHGNRELIEQGTDENGRKFYKIFYREEN